MFVSYQFSKLYEAAVMKKTMKRKVFYILSLHIPLLLRRTMRNSREFSEGAETGRVVKNFLLPTFVF